jgi:Photosynthesis system II assembly factor YCF48/Putative zinc-finger
MPELSQLVRQRLASRGIAGDHPDADLLTAYAEQLLPAAERKQVLEHIAACGTCREVVALSLPVRAESGPVPALATPRRAWRWRPALGLAASLAMLAVVTTLIVELPRKPATFESAKQSPAPVNPTEANSLKAVPQNAQPESAGATNEPRAAAPRATEPGIASGAPAASRGPVGVNAGSVSREAPAPPPSPVRTDAVSTSSSPAVANARLRERDYVNKQMFVAGQAGNDVAANTVEIPAAPLPRLPQSQFPPPLSSNAPLTFAGLPPQTEDGKVLRSRQLSNPPSNHFGLGLIPNLPALGRRAEAKAEALAKRTVAIPPTALTFSAMESKALSPAREDQVQSTDGAVTDEKAKGDLDQSSAFSQRALAGNAIAAMNGAGSVALWRVVSGKLLKSMDSTSWTDGYTGESIEFTVVTAHGSSIWAGGANASLVHSLNGGATWERITLGASATGAIASIEAAGLNVRVKSSSGQEWSSQDGGKTWSLDK